MTRCCAALDAVTVALLMLAPNAAVTVTGIVVAPWSTYENVALIASAGTVTVPGTWPPMPALRFTVAPPVSAGRSSVAVSCTVPDGETVEVAGESVTVVGPSIGSSTRTEAITITPFNDAVTVTGVIGVAISAVTGTCT